MKSKINLYITAILLLTLSACKVSKDIMVPADATPLAYRNTTSVDTSSIATIQWRDFFINKGLQQLVDSAMMNNFDIEIAIKNIEAGRLVLTQSKLGNLPSVNLQAVGSFTRPSDNSLNGLSLGKFLGKSYIKDYSVSAVISWEADIWGKIKNHKARSLAGYLQTGEALKAVQTSLIADIAKGYYNLLMLDAQVEIAKKNLLLIDSTLRIIQLQYNAGQVTALAVQQATEQRWAAAQLIPLLEQEINIQENALSLLAGLPPAAIKRNGDLNDAIADKVSAGVPTALLQNRPDVRSRELALNIANANTGIAKANMYPTLSITAAGGLNAFKTSNWFNIPASLFGAVAGGITQPLFQRKQLRTQYELAKIDREKTVIEFRQSVLIAVGEVADALVKVEKLKEQETIAATRVSTLHNAVGNASLLFKNGMANYLEVILAQRNVLQVELQLAMLKKEQLSARVELYRALGGGWK